MRANESNISKPSTKLQPTVSVTLADLSIYAMQWRLQGAGEGLTAGSLENRDKTTRRLLQFLQARGYDQCGRAELAAFRAWLVMGEGRPRGAGPLRPSTARLYHGLLVAFWRFIVEMAELPASPMAEFKAPRVRQDQVQPFSADQQRALRDAARKSTHPRRNEAIVLFLLDTGARASELCGLRWGDVDWAGSRATVHGKGNKKRMVYFSSDTMRALWALLISSRGVESRPRLGSAAEKPTGGERSRPMFRADRGPRPGNALTRQGLHLLIQRLGQRAGVEAVRCSPHTFRHTFAVEFLRSGGNVFTLQQLLGHTHLAMTQRYVALADADSEAQHRRHSPVESLRRGER